jgi:hypothetical protein
LVEVVEELSWGDDFTACEAAEDGGDDVVGWGVVSVFQARGIVFLIHVATNVNNVKLIHGIDSIRKI